MAGGWPRVARDRDVIDWPMLVAVISGIVASASWLTSARKGRVDNLCQIIDAQSKRIGELEEDLGSAKMRITELESENREYLRLLRANRIDPWELETNAP